MKDIKIEWFSGTGKGGQHRNKHANCCRVTCLVTGLKAQGTESRSREQNKRVAIERLESRIRSHFAVKKERRTTSEVIRTYHAVRNDVRDHLSGFHQTYKEVVIDRDISKMIEERRKAHA